MKKAEDANRKKSSVFEFAPLVRTQARILQSRRDRCTGAEQYRQAGRIHRELEEMLAEHESKESEKFRMKQMQKHVGLISRQAAELKEFDEEWRKKMQEFEDRVAYLRGSFQDDQRDDHKKHVEELRASAPQLRTSKQLQNLHNQAASLAKLQKFDEADFIKMEADAYERKEVLRYKSKMEHHARRGGTKSFMAGQRSQRNNFENRIESELLRLNVAKRDEAEKLLKRQQMERQRFFAKSARETAPSAGLLDG